MPIGRKKDETEERHSLPIFITPTVPEPRKNWDITQPLPELSETVRRFAVLDDPDAGRISLLDEAQQGKPIPEHGMKQLFHALDIDKYSRPDLLHRDQIDTQRGQMIDLLARNEFVQALENDPDHPTKNTFRHLDVEIPKARRVELFTKDLGHFYETDTRFTPSRIRQLVSEEIDTPSLAKPIAEIAYSPDGNFPGSRPRNESDALYQYMNTPSQSYHREQERNLQNAKERSEKISWFQDDELKKKFGSNLDFAAWQLGLRKTANELLYGLHNSLNDTRGLVDKSVPKPKYAPDMSPEEISLEARYPNHVGAGQFLFGSLLNKAIGQLVKGPQGFNLVESTATGVIEKPIQHQGKKPNNPPKKH